MKLAHWLSPQPWQTRRRAASIKVGKFAVCRGSLRGWTTGATAAVGPRVIEEPYSYRDRLTGSRRRDLHWARAGTRKGWDGIPG